MKKNAKKGKQPRCIYCEARPTLAEPFTKHVTVDGEIYMFHTYCEKKVLAEFVAAKLANNASISAFAAIGIREAK